MFWHNFKYAFITMLRNRETLFWTMGFPFMLAILFNVAFANLHNYDTFKAFDVAVVDDESYKNSQFLSEGIKAVSEGDDKVFETRYVNKDEAEQLLDDEKIEGYIYVENNEPHVKIKKNGVNQTVMATVVEQISQTATITTDMVGIEIARAEGPVDIAQVAKEAAAKAIATEPNVKDESHTMNVVSIEFFTLIAMACMQGAMVSVELMNRSLPNITNRGKRVAVAPTKKSVIVFSNLLAGYIMVLATVILLILFTRFILGVEYGGSLALIGLLSAVGSLAATMLGMFLSVALKTRESAKNIIVVIVTMVGSLFAGMFGGMKIFFDELLPFVNKISPVGLITDGFYSLLYYDDMGRYVINILSLLAVAAVFFVLSVRSLRRQRYDSI